MLISIRTQVNLHISTGITLSFSWVSRWLKEKTWSMKPRRIVKQWCGRITEATYGNLSHWWNKTWYVDSMLEGRRTLNSLKLFWKTRERNKNSHFTTESITNKEIFVRNCNRCFMMLLELCNVLNWTRHQEVMVEGQCWQQDWCKMESFALLAHWSELWNSDSSITVTDFSWSKIAITTYLEGNKQLAWI